MHSHAGTLPIRSHTWRAQPSRPTCPALCCNPHCRPAETSFLLLRRSVADAALNAMMLENIAPALSAAPVTATMYLSS